MALRYRRAVEGSAVAILNQTWFSFTEDQRVVMHHTYGRNISNNDKEFFQHHTVLI